MVCKEDTARVTHANILSRGAQAKFTLRKHSLASLLKRVILAGAFHEARFTLMT